MHQIESFFLGIIAALGALTMQLVLYIGFSFFGNQNFALTFEQIFAIPGLIIAGAFIEELFKYLVILKRVETFSLEKTYLVNSFLVGLGFFAIESGLIYQNTNLPQINALVEIAIIHIGTAGILGYLLATKNPKKISTFLFSLIIVTLLHSSYNFLVIDRNFIINYLIYTLLFVIIFFNVLNFLKISSKLAQD